MAHRRQAAALVLAVALAACRPASEAPVPAGRPVAIAPDEVVRRLSALLFRAPPDPQQRAAAGALNLSTSTGVAALARAMLRDPRAVAGLERFVQHWLEVDGLSALPKDAPAWDQALADEMVAEVRRFVAHVVREGDGRLETLLTAPLAFPGERLAALYGFPDVRGASPRLVRHDGQQRLGILGLPGVIALRSRAARTYPSHRGNLVAFRLACRTVIMIDQVDPITPGRTMRQAQDTATSLPACQTCHHLMNPPGWAFEHFDALGGWRTTDTGLPVDASGKLPPDLLEDGGGELPFDGLPDLARAVAHSPRAPVCHAMWWLTFAVPPPAGPAAVARDIDAGQLPPGLPEVLAAFEASGHDLPTLIAAVASSAPFVAP
jgi:hypothetical protein